MTNFAHAGSPVQHAAVVRAEYAAQAVRQIAHRLGRAAAGGALLLAGLVAALLVIANQVVDTWTDGHLLAAWIVMWTVVFAALAFFGAPIGRVSAGLQLWLKRQSQKRRQAAEDAKLWRLAQQDSRMMADLSRAMSSAAMVRELKTHY